jgi:hypothetical protein
MRILKGILPIVALVGIFLVAVGIAVMSWWLVSRGDDNNIASFTQCAAAGNPVMESYPRQCRANGQTFVEEVVNTNETLNINIPVNRNTNQTTIPIDFIETGRVVYGVGISSSMVPLLEQDCRTRNGTFNTCDCASRTSNTNAPCLAVCAYSCRLPATTNLNTNSSNNVNTNNCNCTDDEHPMCNPSTNERKPVPSGCTCGELNDVTKLRDAGWVECPSVNVNTVWTSE